MNLNTEKKLWKRGYKYVACLDEAGRGPLAGPVTAAAVAVRPAKLKIKSEKLKNLRGVKDSKQLTPKKREKLYQVLIKHPAIEWGIGKVSEKVIDKINILEATKLAMENAIENLKSKIQNPKSKIDYLILDGNFKIDVKIPQKSIIKGDEKVFSCAAASILAKVCRDRIMERYDKKYPQYGFKKHKGYPTKLHLKMLRKYGPCKIHRISFKPVRTCNLK